MAQSNRGRPRSKEPLRHGQHAQPAPHAAMTGGPNRQAGADFGNGAVEQTLEKPHWDEGEHELTYLGRLVKRLGLLAYIQELVFRAFENQGWCRRIRNPLPPGDGKRNPKRYLHHTIQNLNANQYFAGIEFFADGTGQHLCWRPTASARRRATALLRRESS